MRLGRKIQTHLERYTYHRHIHKHTLTDTHTKRDTQRATHYDTSTERNTHRDTPIQKHNWTHSERGLTHIEIYTHRYTQRHTWTHTQTEITQ